MSVVVQDYTALLAYQDNANLRFNAFADLGVGTIITYRFVEDADLPSNDFTFYGTDEYQSFSEIQRTHARSAIEEAAKVSGLIFVEIEDGPAMIDLYSAVDTDGSGVSASGYADYGMGLANSTNGSELVMIYQDFTPGGFTYQIVLHELGHSLGLGHPHEGGKILDDAYDINTNTVMTYNYNRHHQMEEYGTFDIEALSHIYGDAATTEGFQTRVDANGLIIVLASDRDDSFIAADIDTKLSGRMGDDTLYGREGNDILKGGNGDDMLQGGQGDDRIFGNRDKDIIIGDTGTTYFGGADHLAGGLGGDYIDGNGGNDSIWGNEGNDELIGGYGNDRIMGGVGGDTITGQEGDDIMSGGKGADRFVFTIRDHSDDDTITDIGNGRDVIDLTALDLITASNLSITQAGDDVELYSYSYNLSILLLRTQLAEFDTDTIAFA